MDATKSHADSISLELRYDDAGAAIAFLTRAFGFALHGVERTAGDRIARAILRAGNGSLLVGSTDAGEAEFRSPHALDGVSTGSVYVAMPDIDALHARAAAAGAHIIHAPADTDYGSRDCTAVDPEGFLWYFGTYHPTADGGHAVNSNIFAGLRYADARAAMAWLGRAFGFEQQFVVPGDGDDIAHAQLRLGDSLLMLGSARDDEYNLKTPRDMHGAFTHKLHVYVTDPDAHCAHARSADADIMLEPTGTADGARGYTVRDPEGYVWTFSTFHPAFAARVPTFER